MKHSEVCYLRLLLKNRPADSYNDLLTYNGITYNTFQESAQQHGFLKDTAFLKEEFLDIFQRVSDVSLRRKHFAMWLGLDYPVNFMFNNGQYSTLKSNNQNDNGYLYKEMVKDWIIKVRLANMPALAFSRTKSRPCG